MNMANRFLVIIPAYNEASTIEQVVRLSQQHADVCVVNDASTDATPEILAGISGIHCIHHTKNTHISGAIMDGMRYAKEADYDFCLTIDAGMSHDPETIVQFKSHEGADLVIGYREKRVKVPIYRKALSLAGKTMMNCALNRGMPHGMRSSLKDVTSGYRMYSRKAINLLLERKIKSRSFDFHLEALAHIYRSGMKIEEVPIVYVFSNSSLRWKVVGEALQTWKRIWIGDDFRVPSELGV
jgi:dolichol-phosphate mannosyltransferase